MQWMACFEGNLLTNEIYLITAETHKRERQKLAKPKIQNLFTSLF